MEKDGVFIYPNVGSGNPSSIDPNLLLALNNGGGFGNNGNWMWIMFLWWMSMYNNGNFGYNGTMKMINRVKNNDGCYYIMENSIVIEENEDYNVYYYGRTI